MTTMRSEILLTGPMTPDDVVAIARHDARLVAGADAERRVLAARAVVERYLAMDVPVYGLTTGLGAGVDTRLSPDDLVAFQMRVADGRSIGVGPSLPREAVRAMIASRIAGMAAGGTGVSLPLFSALVAALNAGVHPVVPAFGSIGAADLAPLAHMARGLLGFGEAEYAGEVMPAACALERAGLAPLPLGPKDGHALVVANSLSTGLACLRLDDLDRLFGWSLAAIALMFEAFRGNVVALDDRALAARPAFGQREVAARLRTMLAGGALMQDGAARRLQDPLSYRCVPQVWGALHHAISEARLATEIELASSGDNPIVLPDGGQMLSQGNFDLTAFVLSWERLDQAIAHCAVGTAHRTMKIMSAGLSDLPRFLSPLGASRSGFQSVQKLVSSTEAHIRHLALPISLSPMPVSDGVEDQASMAPAVLAKTEAMIGHMRHLVAIELIVAAQALELRGVADELGAGTRAVHAAVREQVAELVEDRATGPDIARLAAVIAEAPAPTGE
jgi:histidine ammonia-lyase